MKAIPYMGFQSISDASRALNVPRSTLMRWEELQINPPRLRNAVAICSRIEALKARVIALEMVLKIPITVQD